MDAELIESFLKAFESLPYDVLWKCDSENLPREVKNVHVKKWFPQRDLLGNYLTAFMSSFKTKILIVTLHYLIVFL